MANVSTNIRIDEEIKRQAGAIFAELGMDMSTAVNVFLRQTIRHNGLPFSLQLDNPNEETLMAIREAEAMKRAPENYKSYASPEEMMKDLLK